MNATKRERRALSVVSVIGVIAAGVLLSLFFIWTAPTTKPEDTARPPKLVQTQTVSPGNERLTVTAHGSVIPSRRVIVRPQVTGRVVRQHEALVPGGLVEGGAELIAIDPKDYELLLVEKQTELEEAEFELEVERGRQVVAAREWRLLKGDLPESDANRSLVLREPHLRRTEARIRKAKNQIAKAELDLSRTSVRAPFNATVLEESVEVGQLVEQDSAIATLAGADEFWVQASLSIDKLRWIQFPDGDRDGAEARVILESGNGGESSWRGRVARLLSDLELAGRMARVLITVPDPLGLGSGQNEIPLFLGSYVRVEIDAGELKDVVRIQRRALREGDQIWVVDEDQRLQIRKVEILWAAKGFVLIANTFQPGEELIVSPLRVALPGMKVNPKSVPATAKRLFQNSLRRTEVEREAERQGVRDAGDTDGEYRRGAATQYRGFAAGRSQDGVLKQPLKRVRANRDRIRNHD